ncbi:MAG: hypothetical protein RII27_07775, partial [Alphaproteobacteria bacterium]
MSLAEKRTFSGAGAPQRNSRPAVRDVVRPVNPRDGQRATSGLATRLLNGAAELLYQTPLWRLSLGGRR